MTESNFIGLGKRGHIAVADTLLLTHCCGHIVADTNVSPFARARNICCGHKFCVRNTKVFLILFRNILCPQKMFPSLRSPRNIMSNNESATICPRLPGPYDKNMLFKFLPSEQNQIEGFFNQIERFLT